MSREERKDKTYTGRKGRTGKEEEEVRGANKITEDRCSRKGSLGAAAKAGAGRVAGLCMEESREWVSDKRRVKVPTLPSD